jgi:putative peptidoglycan lipid II flippase
VRRQDYRATLIVMSGLALATGTGFLREAALAFELGAGKAMDTFLIAFTVPEFFFIALPVVLVPAVIPLFADIRLQAGDRAVWRFALRVAGALVVLLLGLTALAAWGAPLYLPWLAPGFGPAALTQAQHALYVMLPAISLMGLAALVGAFLQIQRRFGRPALSTAAYNLTFVAVLLGLPLIWLVGRAALGVTLAASVALAIQIPMVLRYRTSRTAPEQERATQQPGIGPCHLARVAAPLAAAYATHHLILFVDRAMATTLQVGSVAALNYAYRLALAVGQLSGLAVSTALFPRMSEQAAGGDHAGLQDSLASALRFVWRVGLPAAAGLIVLRQPLVEVLFERGAFDKAATAAVSAVLPWYALAVLADAFCQPLWRVLYAGRQGRTVLAVNGLQTTIRVAANVALINPLGYNGLAISAALGLSLQLAVLAWLVRRRLGTYLTRDWWRSAFHGAVAMIPALAASGLLVYRLSSGPALLALLVAGALVVLIYLLLLRLLEKR